MKRTVAYKGQIIEVEQTEQHGRCYGKVAEPESIMGKLVKNTCVFLIARYDCAEKVRCVTCYIMLSYDVLLRLHLHPPSKMCKSFFCESVYNKSLRHVLLNIIKQIHFSGAWLYFSR